MQPVKPDRERLAEVHQQLRRALDAGDWDALGAASNAIGELLAVLPEDARLDVQARQIKQRLEVLHSEALSRCKTECERLREVLHSHTEHAEGRSAYMQVDSLGGDA